MSLRKPLPHSLLGWAKIDTKNKYKPYLLVESMSDNYTDLVAVRLLNGRMPENENEIILPAHLRYNGDLNWTTGDIDYAGSWTPDLPCGSDRAFRQHFLWRRK